MSSAWGTSDCTRDAYLYGTVLSAVPFRRKGTSKIVRKHEGVGTMPLSSGERKGDWNAPKLEALDVQMRPAAYRRRIGHV